MRAGAGTKWTEEPMKEQLGQPQCYRRYWREIVSSEKNTYDRFVLPENNDFYRLLRRRPTDGKKKRPDCLLEGRCVERDNEETAILWEDIITITFALLETVEQSRDRKEIAIIGIPFSRSSRFNVWQLVDLTLILNVNINFKQLVSSILLILIYYARIILRMTSYFLSSFSQ